MTTNFFGQSPSSLCNIRRRKEPTGKIILDIYLNEQIGGQASYLKFFRALRDVKRTDEVTIYMMNFGGQVHTGQQIISAIKDCKAAVHMVVDGPLYSMAPIIALSCDSVEIKKPSFFMFHDYSGVTFGKGSEQEAQVKNMRKYMESFLSYACKPFLTISEIKSILGGQDKYMSFEDVQARLKKHSKRYTKKK